MTASDRAPQPKVLLTGAGSIGQRHARNIRELAPDAALIVVCHGEASNRWAREFGALAVPSVEAGLEANPQLAIVCSISSEHEGDLAMLMPAVEAIYVEKPLVAGLAGVNAVRRLVE